VSWKRAPIGDLCKLVNGRAFKPSGWTKRGLRIVRIQNLNNPSKPFNRYDGEVKDQHIIGNGDILLSWSGTPGTSFGCFQWGGGRAVLNQHIFKVIVDTTNMHPMFFLHAVNAHLSEMIELAHGGVGLRHITKGKLESIEIPVPPLDEQRRIVGRIREAMERVDELRRLRSQTVSQATLIEPSVFADFVEELGESNGELPTVPLGSVLVDTKYGSSSKANTAGKGVPMLRMGNIKDGHLTTDDLKHIELPAQELKKYELLPGDILINRTNSLELVGKAATFNLEGGPWVYASYLVRLRADRDKALPEYLTAVINSRIGRAYVYRTARRAIGMVNINVKEIKAMPIPHPPLPKQRAVIERMADARIACLRLQNLLQDDDVDQLSQAILRKAFAGEL